MIHIFLGTKAQLIKMAPIMKELQERNIEYNFVFSGQHKSTITDIRNDFGLKEPDIILYSGPDITSIRKMFFWSIKVATLASQKNSKVWKGDKDGIVLNHGDTLSTLIGSFSAKLQGLKTAHIESGLRSFNILHPFPEELTRRLTFSLSDFFFAPGEWALQNLSKEKGKKINTENNTLLDSLNAYQETIENIEVKIPQYKYGIVSIHRFENLFRKKRLLEIIKIIEEISKTKRILFILHKTTEEKLNKYGILPRIKSNKNIELRPRYSYFKFIKLLKNSEFIITDGGSNQEECYFLGKPCLIMRKTTERKEGINQNSIISNYDKKIIDHFFKNLEKYKKTPLNTQSSPSKIIIDSIEKYR